MCHRTHWRYILLQTPFRKDLMTSVHMRLFRCLEQYQTAKRAHEFRTEYFYVLYAMNEPIHYR